MYFDPWRCKLWCMSDEENVDFQSVVDDVPTSTRFCTFKSIARPRQPSDAHSPLKPRRRRQTMASRSDVPTGHERERQLAGRGLSIRHVKVDFERRRRSCDSILNGDEFQLDTDRLNHRWWAAAIVVILLVSLHVHVQIESKLLSFAFSRLRSRRSTTELSSSS